MIQENRSHKRRRKKPAGKWSYCGGKTTYYRQKKNKIIAAAENKENNVKIKKNKTCENVNLINDLGPGT